MPAEALGICSCPDGKMHNQVQHLRKKVAAWMDGIRTGRVPKEVAWYCLNSTIMKTIEYPLVAAARTAEFMARVKSTVWSMDLW